MANSAEPTESRDWSTASFASRARVTNKKVGVAPEGTLSIENGSLKFTRGRSDVFDVPLSDVNHVRSPWYMLGAGFAFRLGDTKYTATFNKLTSYGVGSVAGPVIGIIGAGAGIIDVVSGRKLNRAWTNVLSAALQPTA
jgi:hypothetical protein